jgi:hypothetical protein
MNIVLRTAFASTLALVASAAKISATENSYDEMEGLVVLSTIEHFETLADVYTIYLSAARDVSFVEAEVTAKTIYGTGRPCAYQVSAVSFGDIVTDPYTNRRTFYGTPLLRNGLHAGYWSNQNTYQLHRTIRVTLVPTSYGATPCEIRASLSNYVVRDL